MPRKDRKITETDRAFYQIGMEDGERKLRQRYEETLVLLKKTNNALWEELSRLDIELPLKGVLVSFPAMERLIKALAKPKAHSGLVVKFKKMLKEARNIGNIHS